jgi:DNA-binding transcriptional MerR regulator
MIDTLKFANRLRSAGFSQEQAETFADAWAEQAREDLPSRLDLAEIDHKITRLDGKIAQLEDKFDSKIAQLEGKFDNRIAQLEGKIDSKIAHLEGKVDKLTWMVGFALAGILAIIARLLLLGP